MNEPTEEGLKRYPKSEPPGFYLCWPEGSFLFSYPCVCTAQCQSKCKGTCGCVACQERHNDWVAMGGWRTVFSASILIAVLGLGVAYLVFKVFL